MHTLPFIDYYYFSVSEYKNKKIIQPIKNKWLIHAQNSTILRTRWRYQISPRRHLTHKHSLLYSPLASTFHLLGASLFNEAPSGSSRIIRRKIFLSFCLSVSSSSTGRVTVTTWDMLVLSLRKSWLGLSLSSTKCSGNCGS